MFPEVLQRMISIVRANEEDASAIIHIGLIAVEAAHRESCSAEDLGDYLQKHYSEEAIQKELKDPQNLYHLLYYHEKPIGFSKIILNAAHENLPEKNVTKLDRLYILTEYFDLKLGYQLLQHNIHLAKQQNQTGMWLFTWIGNTRAIQFYLRNGFVVIGTHSFKVSENHYNPNHHMLLRWPDE